MIHGFGTKDLSLEFSWFKASQAKGHGARPSWDTYWDGYMWKLYNGKATHEVFSKRVSWRASVFLELIYTDICGPMKTPSLGSQRYFLIFIDDFSRMTWIYFLKEKSEAFATFKKFKALVEKQKGCSIKTIHSDWGGEHTSQEFEEYCKNEGIQKQLTTWYTP